MLACKRLAFCLAGLCAFIACGAVDAVVTTTTYGPFSINCTGGVQLCNNTFSQSITTTGALQVRYNASPGHCSNLRAHILVDGVERAVTAFLTPGQASGFFNVGPVSAGAHTVALQAEGTVGGCNVGFLVNWGGTLDVMADVSAPVVASAIPTLDGSMLALMAVLIGVIAASMVRRRR